jgi:hypothetical protein
VIAMKSACKSVLVAAFAALALGGVAQAGEFDSGWGSDRGGFTRPDRGGYGGRHWDDGRYYGRPVHRPWRPVFAGPRWGWHDDCRLIVKRRVNPWGDVVVRRIRVCG